MLIKFCQILLIYYEGLRDNNNKIFIYGVLYCFYFQHQTYNFSYFKRIIENKKITLGNYVEEKIKKS